MSTSIQNDFYLYLVNKLGANGGLEASCNLPSNIDLSRHNYEISLVEIQLPSLWHNVYDASITIWSLDDPDQRVEKIIPDGYYKNFDAVGRTVDRLGKLASYKLENKLFNTHLRLGKSESGKSYLVIGPGIGVELSERLMLVFGLRSTHYTNDDVREDRVQIKPDVDL